MTASPASPSPSDPLATDLKRLEEIVRTLERDDVDLDRALALFEEGVRHLKSAKARLNEAEARVARVVEDAAGVLSLTELDD
jgi:exodeoxyribonuclease VII small subunit